MESSYFIGSFFVSLCFMIVDLSLSARSWLWMESFRFPFLGKLIHAIKFPTRIYSDMALKLVGFKDLVLANEIVIDENDEKNLIKVKNMFSFAKKAIGTPQNLNLISINKSIEISLKTINEIEEIHEHKRKYEQLKKNMFAASSAAIIANLNKYKEPVHENK